jgi:prepilin signal peptidase PulO-like enzyme (type II secretory pathway)
MVMIVLILILFGLCVGSFINALVWRLHQAEKGKPKNKTLSIVKGRSMCVHCHHTLGAKDLVPLFSWLELRGKCRYCHQPISAQYPLVELLTAVLFVISYLAWPTGFISMFQWLNFVLWLPGITLGVALAVYDSRWMLLPNKLVYIMIGVSLGLVLLRFINDPVVDTLLTAGLGVLCLAGLFYAFFQLSGGKWIGGGDVKLAIALGLLVGGPTNAFLLLFLASFGGSLVAIPLLMAGKAKRSTHVPFGPFLIAATYIVYLFGSYITLWYERVFLGL